MKRTFLHAAWVLLLALSRPAGAADTNASPIGHSATKAAVTTRFDFESFRIIAERNIFDPNRSARGDTRSTRREPDRRVRTQSFALLGTMSYEKGRYAFFDGSSSDYRKVVQPAGTIAGFKVAAVAPTCVRLETDAGRIIELCVGMQLSKREEEDWQISERPASVASASSDKPRGATEGSGGEADEVAKRLMQRRGEEAPPDNPGAGARDVAATASAAAAAAVEKQAPDSAPDSGPASAAEADDVVKRLLQKREQELNK